MMESGILIGISALVISALYIVQIKKALEEVEVEINEIYKILRWILEPTEIEEPKEEAESKPELPSTGHTIVVGQSGSGKSNVLMHEVIQRLKQGQKLYIIDTKREFNQLFRKHAKILSLENAQNIFSELENTIQERLGLFEEAALKLGKPVKDLATYNRLTNSKLPYITLVAEELIVLVDEIGKDALVKLLVLGRSSGVFCLVASQYLNAEILPRKGTINFNNRIFLGELDRIALGILFGNIEKQFLVEAKEFLGEPGKALVGIEGKIEMKQMPLVSDAQLEEWM